MSKYRETTFTYKTHGTTNVVRQNDSLIFGRNNPHSAMDQINRMLGGKAPLDDTSTPVQIHHIQQKCHLKGGKLVEVARHNRKGWQRVLHDPRLYIIGKGGKKIPIKRDGINRGKFRTWEENYWKARGQECMQATRAAKERGQIDKYRLSRFQRTIQQTGLEKSYNSTHPKCPVPLRGTSGGNIGGVGNDVGMIKGLEKSIIASLDNEHCFLFRTSDGSEPFSKRELSSIIRSLVIGIYRFDAIPWFSLHFNTDRSLFPVIHPVYANTLVGRCIGMLDYWMKGFLNGAIYDEDFLLGWEKNRTFNEDELRKHLVCLYEYCERHVPGSNYSSMRDINSSLGLDPDHEMSGGNASDGDKNKYGVNQMNYMTSFRIIGKQNSFQKIGNTFVIDAGFDVFYDIEPSPDYQEYLEFCRREGRGEPSDFQTLVLAHERMRKLIEELMPKLPFCSKVFNQLKVINFLCHYLVTMKQMNRVPNLMTVPAETFRFPKILPPYPVAFMNGDSSFNLSYFVDIWRRERHRDFENMCQLMRNSIQVAHYNPSSFENEAKSHVDSFTECCTRREINGIKPNKEMFSGMFMQIVKQIVAQVRGQLVEARRQYTNARTHLQNELQKVNDLESRISSDYGLKGYLQESGHSVPYGYSLDTYKARNALQQQVIDPTKLEIQGKLREVDEEIRKLERVCVLDEQEKTSQFKFPIIGVYHGFEKVEVETFGDSTRIKRISLRGGCGVDMHSSSEKRIIENHRLGNIVSVNSSLFQRTKKMSKEEEHHEEEEKWVQLADFDDEEEKGYWMFKIQMNVSGTSNNEEYDHLTSSLFDVYDLPEKSRSRRRGEEEWMKKLYSAYYPGENGGTPLHMCAHSGDVRTLVEMEGSRNLILLPETGDIVEIPKYIPYSIPDDDGFLVFHNACCSGKLDIVKFCVESRRVDVNVETRDHMTGLMLAIEGGHVDVVRYLLLEKRARTDVKSSCGMFALYLSIFVERPDIALLILSPVSAPSVRRTTIDTRMENGENALHLACELGYSRVVESLLRLGADIHLSRNDGMTAMHLCAYSGNLECLNLLLQHHGSTSNYVFNATVQQQHPLSARLGNGHTPFFVACKRGHVDIVKRLCTDYGRYCALGDVDKMECTPLMQAIRNGREEVALYLCNQCRTVGELHYMNTKEDTALLLTGRLGLFSVGDMIIEKTPRGHKERYVRRCDVSGWNYFHYLCRGGKYMMIKKMITKTCCAEGRNNSSERKYSAKIFETTQKSPGRREEYLTPIMIAAMSGRNETVSLLRKYDKSMTCDKMLFWTAKSDNIDELRKFAKEKFGEHKDNNYLDLARFPMFKVGKRGGEKSFLYLCAEHGSIRCLKFLFQHCKLTKLDDVITSCFGDRHVFYGAVDGGDTECADYLISQLHLDVSVLDLDREETKAVMIATRNSDFEMLDFLMRRGGRLSSTNKNGEGCFDEAIVSENEDMMKYLLSHQDFAEKKLTPSVLFSVVKCGTVTDFVDMERKMGNNSNYVDLNMRRKSDGETLLTLAVKENKEQFIDFLLRRKRVDVSRKNRDGETALSLSLEMKNVKNARFMIAQFHRFNPSLDLKKTFPNLLYSACEHGLYELIPPLLSMGYSTEVRMEGGGRRSLIEIFGKKDPLMKGLLRGGDYLFLKSMEDMRLQPVISGLAECKLNLGNRLHILLKKMKIPGVSLPSNDKEKKIRDLSHKARGLRPSLSSAGKWLLDSLCTSLGEVLEDFSKLSRAELLQRDSDGNNRLHHAAMSDKPGMFDRLLMCWRGLDVDVENNEGKTPLMIAIAGRNIEMVKAFLNAGADVNFIGKKKLPPLFAAILAKDRFIVQLLLSKGADVNGRGTMLRCTPLHISIESGDENTTRILLEGGCKVDVPDILGRTALTMASINGEVDLVKVLVGSGSDLESKTKRGLTPLITATIGGNYEAAKTLIELGANVNEPERPSEEHLRIQKQMGNDLSHNLLTNAVGYACLYGKERILNLLFLHNGNFGQDADQVQSEKTPQGKSTNSIVKLVSQSGNVGFVRRFLTNHTKLLNSIENINAGVTTTVTMDFLDVLKFLLDVGGSTSMVRIGADKTLLDIAAERGSTKCLEFLMNEGTNGNNNNNNNNNNSKKSRLLMDWKKKDCNPFYSAIKEGKLASFEVLLAAQAQEDETSLENLKNGHLSLLHSAVESNQLRFVLALLLAGFRIDAKDERGCTPLHISARRGNVELSQLLILCGCDSKIRYGRKSYLELPEGNLMYMVVMNKFDTEFQKHCASNPLLYVAREQEAFVKSNSRLDVLRFLLYYTIGGVEGKHAPEEIERMRDVALLEAVKRGDLLATKELVCYGASVCNAKDDDGNCPLDVAIDHNDETSSFLKAMLGSPTFETVPVGKYIRRALLMAKYTPARILYSKLKDCCPRFVGSKEELQEWKDETGILYRDGKEEKFFDDLKANLPKMERKEYQEVLVVNILTSPQVSPCLSRLVVHCMDIKNLLSAPFLFRLCGSKNMKVSDKKSIVNVLERVASANNSSHQFNYCNSRNRDGLTLLSVALDSSNVVMEEYVRNKGGRYDFRCRQNSKTQLDVSIELQKPELMNKLISKTLIDNFSGVVKKIKEIRTIEGQKRMFAALPDRVVVAIFEKSVKQGRNDDVECLYEFYVRKRNRRFAYIRTTLRNSNVQLLSFFMRGKDKRLMDLGDVTKSAFWFYLQQVKGEKSVTKKEVRIVSMFGDYFRKMSNGEARGVLQAADFKSRRKIVDRFQRGHFRIKKEQCFDIWKYSVSDQGMACLISYITKVSLRSSSVDFFDDVFEKFLWSRESKSGLNVPFVCLSNLGLLISVKSWVDWMKFVRRNLGNSKPKEAAETIYSAAKELREEWEEEDWKGFLDFSGNELLQFAIEARCQNLFKLLFDTNQCQVLSLPNYFMGRGRFREDFERYEDRLMRRRGIKKVGRNTSAREFLARVQSSGNENVMIERDTSLWKFLFMVYRGTHDSAGMEKLRKEIENWDMVRKGGFGGWWDRAWGGSGMVKKRSKSAKKAKFWSVFEAVRSMKS